MGHADTQVQIAGHRRVLSWKLVSGLLLAAALVGGFWFLPLQELLAGALERIRGLGVLAPVMGVGIAYSILLGATPLTPEKRQAVQAMTAEVVRKLSGWNAARCCRRDGDLAVREAAAFSGTWLPVKLRAEAVIPCDQFHLNPECIQKSCPLYPGTEIEASRKARTPPLP